MISEGDESELLKVVYDGFQFLNFVNIYKLFLQHFPNYFFIPLSVSSFSHNSQ